MTCRMVINDRVEIVSCYQGMLPELCNVHILTVSLNACDSAYLLEGKSSLTAETSEHSGLHLGSTMSLGECCNSSVVSKSGDIFYLLFLFVQKA